MLLKCKLESWFHFLVNYQWEMIVVMETPWEIELMESGCVQLTCNGYIVCTVYLYSV